MWHQSAGWLLRVVPLAATFLIGCQDRSAPTPTNPAREVAPPAIKPDPPANVRPVFDETKGYLHKPSGVGFIYPEGWDNLGASNRGPINSLTLRKREPPIQVTLYWTKPNTPLNAATVGENEYETLRPLYGNNIGKPEPIHSGEQSGYKLAIMGGPLGQPDLDVKVVIYVFAINRENQSWQIKLRATAQHKDHLKAVEELLPYYRW